VAEVTRLAASYRNWLLEVHYADDGRPSVSAEHRQAKRVLSAHWDAGEWHVVTEFGKSVANAPDLATALEPALK
jgi:hypothetical protein